MLRRSPLKAKRDRPRRNEGRVSHERMKPKAKAAPTAEEKRHIEQVAALGCLACGRPANVHHVMHAPGKTRRRDHRFIVPLCHDHHQGDLGVHGLGSERAFLSVWGVDLVSWSVMAWSLRDALEDPFWTDSVTRCNGIAKYGPFHHKGGRGAGTTNTGFTRPVHNA